MAVLDLMIGWIAPAVCVSCGAEGSALCTACSANIIPYGERCFSCGAVSAGSRTCERCRPDAPSKVWITTGYDGTARELIRVYKFGHLRAASSSMASLMVKTCLGFNRLENLTLQNYLVVPIPTATSRVRQRGFDHSALLARHTARQLKLRYYNGLVRLGQARQVGAVRSLRLIHPEGNYRVRYASLVAGRNILLVDDVVTTGATLREATKVLHAAGAARVDALVFAKRL